MQEQNFRCCDATITETNSYVVRLVEASPSSPATASARPAWGRHPIPKVIRHSFRPPSRRRQCHRGMLHMVSADHFAQELRAQLSRAAKHGSMDIVINSGELYRSVGGHPGSMHGMPACCDAMRSEMKPGDILLVEQASGPGMTVRYRLPPPK
jgi:hypothetical protein